MARKPRKSKKTPVVTKSENSLMMKLVDRVVFGSSTPVPSTWERDLRRDINSVTPLQPVKAVKSFKTEILVLSTVVRNMEKNNEKNDASISDMKKIIDRNKKNDQATKIKVDDIANKVQDNSVAIRDINYTLDSVEKRVEAIDSRLDRLEASFKSITGNRTSNYGNKATSNKNQDQFGLGAGLAGVAAGALGARMLGSAGRALGGAGRALGAGASRMAGLGGNAARFLAGNVAARAAALGSVAALPTILAYKYLAEPHVQAKQDRQAQGLPRNKESDEELSKGLESGWGSRANKNAMKGGGSPGQGSLSSPQQNTARAINAARGINQIQTMDDRIYRDRIDREKSQFMQFGAMPGGFEFINGHRGRLGSPAAVAASGAMPLTGISGMGGSGGGYSGQYRSPGFRSGGYAGPQSSPYSSGGRQGGYGYAGGNTNDPRSDSQSSRQSREQYWGTPGNRGTVGISDGNVRSSADGGEGFGRERFDSQMDAATKEKLFALTLAEVGDSNPAAQRALMETIFNRNQAHGHSSLNTTMNSAYYEPFQNGSYYTRLEKLRNNPELQKELEKRWQEVRAGSNDSNFGLHNSSAGVASSARKTQHVSAEVGGETFSRKTNAAYADLHGSGIIDQESRWFDNTKTAVSEAAKRKQMGGTAPDILPPLTTISKEALTGSVGGNVPGTDKFGSMANKPGMSIPETRKGAPGEFNYALSSEGASEFGEPSSNLKTVPVTTKDGKVARVHPMAAPRMQSFIDSAQARGYKINDIGGYNYRNKVGGSGLSTHATGTTIDLNASKNWIGSSKTDMPHNIEKLGWLHGLSWGARFDDAMHFEVMSPQLRKQRLEQLVKEGFITPDDVAYINKNGVPPPHLVNPSNVSKQETSPVISNTGVEMSKRGITSGMSAKNPGGESLKQRTVSWSSLERPPTKEEVDSSMSKGVKHFDFDHTQPGGQEIAKYIQEKSGSVISYNAGPGNASWNEPYRPMQQVVSEAIASPGKYIHLDNLDQYNDADKIKVINQIKENGKIVIPKNAPEFWAKYLTDNPDYTKNLPLGYIENMSKMGSQEQAFAKKLDSLLPGGLTDMEWPSNADPSKINDVAKSGIPVNLMKGPERPDASGNGGYHAPFGETLMLNSPPLVHPKPPEKLKNKLDMPPGVTSIGDQTRLVQGMDLAETFDDKSVQQAKMADVPKPDAVPLNPDAVGELENAGVPLPQEPAKLEAPPVAPTAEPQTATAPASSPSEPSAGAAQKQESQAENATSGGASGGSGRFDPETRDAEPGSGGKGSKGRCFL